MRFSTDSFAPKHRYEAWRTRGWPSLAPVMDTNPPEGPFFAHTETFALGTVPITYTRITGQAYKRSATKIRSDDIEDIGVLVMLAGKHAGETPNGSFSGASGTVLIGDMGRPYAQASSDAETVTLSLPRRLVREHVPALEGLHGVVLDASQAALIVDHVKMLRRHLGELGDEAGALLSLGVITSIAVSLENAGLTAGKLETSEAAAMRRCQWFVDRHLGDADLSVDGLLGLTGLSRSTLYRLFAEHDGVASYVRHRRLAHAKSVLENPFDTRTISEIAYSLGFRDPAQFSRAFRSRFGVPPSAMRSQRAGDLAEAGLIQASSVGYCD